MTLPTLLSGDVFCSANPWIIGKAIVAVEHIWSLDGKAEFGHSGIITSSDGTTLEALWRVKHESIWRYKGKRLLVARPVTRIDGHKIMHIEKSVALYRLKKAKFGKKYPLHRLLLHLLPPLAKLGNGDFTVCSELTARYLYLIGCRGEQYLGVNPDNLADELIHWRQYKVIFNGVL